MLHNKSLIFQYSENVCSGCVNKNFSNEDCYGHLVDTWREFEQMENEKLANHEYLQIATLLILCVMTALGFFLLRNKNLKTHPYNLYGFEALACVCFIYYWYIWYYILRIAELFVVL